MTNYDRLIRNWHARASEEDYFSKFVFEYLAFIAFLRQKAFPFSTDDRRAIQQLKQDVQIRTRYLLRVNRVGPLRTSWNRIIAQLNAASLGNTSGHRAYAEEFKWWNCSLDQLDQLPPDDRNKPKGKIENLDDWGNMVEFWCAIRNNLFHGTKDPNERRNQILLEHAYKTLRPLLDIFLSDGTHE